LPSGIGSSIAPMATPPSAGCHITVDRGRRRNAPRSASNALQKDPSTRRGAVPERRSRRRRRALHDRQRPAINEVPQTEQRDVSSTAVISPSQRRPSRAATVCRSWRSAIGDEAM
jgi:hypothetical protein